MNRRRVASRWLAAGALAGLATVVAYGHWSVQRSRAVATPTMSPWVPVPPPPLELSSEGASAGDTAGYPGLEPEAYPAPEDGEHKAYPGPTVAPADAYPGPTDSEAPAAQATAPGGTEPPDDDS